MENNQLTNHLLQEDRTNLLEEATEVIKLRKTFLSKNKKIEDKESCNEVISIINRFKEERVEFSPIINLKKIDPDNGSEFNYFHINIPLTLWASSGWNFSRIECRFQILENNSSALIYDIFPKNNIKNISSISIGSNIDLIINNDFNYIANAGYNSEIKAIFGPFSYSIKRYITESRGKLSKKAYWRIDDGDKINNEDINLFVVIRKSNEEISFQCETIAYHKFNFFGGNIFNEYFSDFSAKLKSFINNGLPVYAKQRWKNKSITYEG